MDNTAPAPDRAARQEESPKVPEAWLNRQKELASKHGLSLLLVEGRQPPSLAVVNNNSVCRAFQSSETHSERCQPFCGEAYFRALEKGAADYYRCHAGLHCFATPVEVGDGRPLAVIGGRAFLRSADYRELVERVRSGDLTDLLSPGLFQNVIFSLQPDLAECEEAVREAAAEAATESVSRAQGAAAGAETGRDAGGPEVAPAGGPQARPGAGESDAGVAAEDEAAGRVDRVAPALEEVCDRAVRRLGREQGLESLALLLRSDDHFAVAAATGSFADSPPQITLKPKQIKLMSGSQGGSVAVLPAGRAGTKREAAADLFPLLVGEEVRGALLVADRDLGDERRAAIVEFCRELAMGIEVIRLRDELERRARAASHQHAFAESVNAAEPEEAYAAILRHSAELLRAERGSLLLYDERVGELFVKAAVGPRAEVAQASRLRLGEGVSGAALSEGRPLVVRDVAAARGLKPAPVEREYKTASFISFPILVGGRKVGVLNVTDKTGGGPYDELDLSLLELIAPQLALALDRAEWRQKATQFQLLSITDPLTGLVNRRYLEERLNEELERSKRHRFAMSFMMLDIDDFKSYNDRHGHPAGDLALELTAQCLKAALRSADVAARYGGEEFSVLLPQTGLAEARAIGERVRRQIERTQFPHGKAQPLGAVTVSIGVSTYGVGLDTPAAIMAAADKALYIAKSRGKNCVEVFEARPKRGGGKESGPRGESGGEGAPKR
jgi:diguanylate cyclase (GGDEF)-like protein